MKFETISYNFFSYNLECMINIKYQYVWFVAISYGYYFRIERLLIDIIIIIFDRNTSKLFVHDTFIIFIHSIVWYPFLLCEKNGSRLFHRWAMLTIRIDISRVNGSRDALWNDTYWVKTPPKDGPMNAPAEYNDVNNPEINA